MNIEITSKPIAATSCLINGKIQEVEEGQIVSVMGTDGKRIKKYSFWQKEVKPDDERVNDCIEMIKTWFENA